MIGQFIPAAVDPRSAGPDFWERFHALRRVRQAELRPDDPIEPDERVEANLKRENPFDFHHTYEISREGVMVSWLQGETVKPANPEFATNKHLFWAGAYVRPEARRQGVARLWLPVIAELMDRHGCTVLGIETEDETGHAFLEWLGARRKLVNVESRLRLADVDWSMLERWSAEGAGRSPHTRLEIYDGGPPEAMWADFAPQFTEMFNTMPLEDLDLGDIIITPERLRDWAERRQMSGEILYTVLTREPDGAMSAVTEITWAPYRPRIVHQEFTGVRADARGRGLGKWVKAAMLLHLRDLHPDLEWVVTDNAHSNGPMLKINRTMGFKPYREHVEYQMTRAELEARIRG